MNKLEPILAEKQREIAALHLLIQQQPMHPIAQLLSGKIKRPLKKSVLNVLRQQAPAVIGEIKRKSPVKNLFATIADPVQLANHYAAAGAAAISVLTDEKFFSGSLNDLIKVSHALRDQPHVILRKDFIIDDSQIAESAYAGADAILGIVLVLGKKIADTIKTAKTMGMDTVVEVNHADELALALDCGAEIIAINNRDLRTFEMDTDRSFRLVEAIPKSIIKIAASGIFDPQLAQRYFAAGFDAVLIGEGLVTVKNPQQFIQECRHETAH